ncbi:helicase RepA family protein [Desulfovibrio sp. OttesenSCG-928-M16]|nr:helicase RepA family protein [Desulfovibrio sp. OttesenSCG-928-M16]
MTRAVDPIAEQLQGMANDTPTLKGRDEKSEAPLFKILSCDDILNLPPLSWKVKGVVPDRGTVVFHGASGSGKSFIVIDLSIAAAIGQEWFGWKTTQCDILYICLESSAGLQARLKAWMKEHQKRLPGNFNFIINPFNLTDSKHIDEISRIAPKNGVLVIDTLNRATPGADENSSKDMSSIISAADTIQAAMQGLVLLVAHSGKDTAKGIRGHSSLFAALDANIEIGRNGDTRFVKVPKVKEGEDGAKKYFRLKSVVVGTDADGDDMTSCVVEPLDSSAIGRAEDKPPTKSQIYALESFDKAARFERAEIVHVDTWRPYFYAGHTADNDEAKQKAFQRARKELVAIGKLSVLNGNYKRTDRTNAGQVR